MRIIAGSAKGKKIIAPKGKTTTRPALAKVREAIFSSLGDVSDCVIADIFAGTGSLGLEALSRGARFSYFIESDQAAMTCIINNLESLGFSAQARVLKRMLPHGLKNVNFSHKADIIFCDPPYDKNLLNPTLKALLTYNFIDADSLIIVEHSPRELPEIKELSVTKHKKYGQTLISYLKRLD